MPEKRNYIVGKHYVDKGFNGKHNKDDELQYWNIASNGITIQNSGGIRPRSFTKEIRSYTTVPSSVYLFELHYEHKDVENPWRNIVINNDNKIIHCGDALFDSSDPNKKLSDFKGNKIFKKIYEENKKNPDIDLFCPILHFTKFEEGRAVFNGLCHITKLEKYFFEHRGHTVENYKVYMDIMHFESVDIEWINSRSTVKDKKELKLVNSELGPHGWSKYLEKVLS